MTTDKKCIRRPHAYWTTCRCDDCRVDQARKVKRREVLGYDRPSALDAWERFTGWVDAGYSWAWIADATGLNEHSLFTAHYEANAKRKPYQFGFHYSARILAADITRSTRGTCPARGLTRRLRALARIGWGVNAIADESGVPFTTIACIQRGDVDSVTATNAAAIRETYVRVENQPRGSKQSINRAERLGWPAPAAWNDIDLDDEPAATTRTRKGLRTLEDYEWLTANGYSRDEALQKLGVTYDAIVTGRRRRAEADEAA